MIAHRGPNSETDLHSVLALVHPPQSTFELACCAEVFGVQRAELPVHYSFGVCAEESGPVATLAGYDMAVTTDLTGLESAHTVIIPGWQSHRTAAPPAIIGALRAAHARGARIVAICAGTFLLAETGLLHDRRATTHWRLAAELTERFPDVHVDANVLYVDLGDVATSAGTAAGIDLCLHLVRRDLGAAYATTIARHMVMPPSREGGQLQYASPPMRHRWDALAPVMDWAVARLAEQITVNDLARKANLSPRTFARRFNQEVGVSPGRWMIDQRISAARTMLEQTDVPIDTVAARVGLSSATNLRRHFQRYVRTTPAAYRRAFRQFG